VEDVKIEKSAGKNRCFGSIRLIVTTLAFYGAMLGLSKLSSSQITSPLQKTLV
jgi:hypothetical protein